MSDVILQDALDAAERGEPVTVTLDANTVEALADFWAARKRAWRRWHLDDDDTAEFPPGYAPGAPVAVGCVIWLAAGDAESLAQLKGEVAKTLLAEAER